MCFFITVYGAALGFHVGFSREVPRLGVRARAGGVGVRCVGCSGRD